MIVDAHYHLEERMETVDELLDQMDPHGISRVALIAAMVDPLQVEGIAAALGNWSVESYSQGSSTALTPRVNASCIAVGCFWISPLASTLLYSRSAQ
jgi:hypothetical protein